MITNRKKLYSIIALVIAIFVLGVVIAKKVSSTRHSMDSAAREAINTKLRNQFMNTMREVVGIVQNISSHGEGLRSLAVQIELPDVSPPKVFTSSTPKLVQKI